MTDIVDLAAERTKREAPDADQVRRDDYGRPMYRFLISYWMGEREYGTHVWAYDWEDADAKVAAMRESLSLDGQCFGTVPA